MRVRYGYRRVHPLMLHGAIGQATRKWLLIV